ncbi:MAG: hypothetical protein ACI4OG_01555 [Bacilli bacterium]
MNEKKTKNVVIIALCITLIFMGVGFAILSQNLTINTTGSIVSDSTWDIHLEDFATGITKVGGDKVTASASGDGTTVVTANFTLEKPGDSVTFTGKIVNAGTLDATLESVVNNIDEDFDGKGYIIKTVNIIPAVDSDLLAANAGDTDEAQISITYSFDETVEDLPTETVSISDTIIFNYVQK